jgi:hypothetical protein
MEDVANRHLIAFQQGDRRGFKKPDGTVVVNPVFEQVGEFRYGLCPVRVTACGAPSMKQAIFRSRLHGFANSASATPLPKLRTRAGCI